MASLMERLRHALGMHSAPPTMSDEQQRVADWQKRIERRQDAIDIQIEVLRADKRDRRPSR